MLLYIQLKEVTEYKMEIAVSNHIYMALKIYIFSTLALFTTQPVKHGRAFNTSGPSSERAMQRTGKVSHLFERIYNMLT